MSGYSKDVIKKLIENNPFFASSEEQRYAYFRDIDPFPKITASLLNSVDIIKYVMTTGMIKDFNIENLTGATYTCEISGEYIFWDDNKVETTSTIGVNEELVLSPNSITFIAIKQYFRIPSYMVLRFNLKVTHVYKGLLLGTGPIVDPGFNGQIYIPLHNLTSNEYIIKKDALIIDVEFTKMSNTTIWKLDTEHKNIVDSLNFTNIKYIPPSIKPGRTFREYINKALSKDDLFHKKNREKIHINSSLPEKIHEFEGKLELFQETIRKNSDQIAKDSRRMEKTENYVKSFTLITAIGVIVACIALGVSSFYYFSSSMASKTIEAEKKVESLKQINDDIQKKYDDEIKNLKNRIDDLEQQIKK